MKILRLMSSQEVGQLLVCAAMECLVGDPQGPVVGLPPQVPGQALHLAAGPSEGDVQSLIHPVLGARQMLVQARYHCITLTFHKMMLDPFHCMWACRSPSQSAWS